VIQLFADKVTDRFAERVARSKFLQRLGGLTLVGLGVNLARTQTAMALWNQHGCSLCFTPAAYGGPSCPGELACVWCWIGGCHTHNGVPNRKHYCCEGHTNTGCGGGCSGAVCSYLSGTYAC
jgi:hypothetical protein